MTASIEISIGNPRCYGEPLTCQVAWCLSQFGAIDFSVGDLLQVYNYTTIGHPTFGLMSESDAQATAEAEGTAWLDQHRALFADTAAECPVRVFRWRDWQRQPGFPDAVADLQRLYETQLLFRNAVTKDVSEFVRRRAHHPPSDHDVNTLARFILEELAVYQLQTQLTSTVNVYAGSELHAERAIRRTPSASVDLARRHFAYLTIRQGATSLPLGPPTEHAAS